MKLRLLPLSILLVTSMAACQKNGPSASITPNPNAPAAKDSTVKIKDTRWDWTGHEPFSYKMDGTLVKSAQSLTFFKSGKWMGNDIFYTTIYSWSDSGTKSGDDTLMNMIIPARLDDMRIGDEFNMPNSISFGGQLFKFDHVPDDPEIKTAFVFSPLEGGSLHVKITNITATEFEGKFYGVLKQRSDTKSSSGIGWVKIEEGYFKFNRADTTFL